MALLVVMYALLSEPSNLTTAWQVFVPLYAVSLLFGCCFAPLWLLWWASRRLPEPGGDRPPRRHHRPGVQRGREHRPPAALDRRRRRALRRTGPVIVSNDGSIDRTEAIARAEIAGFAYASGRVLTAPNGGQSMALNRALALTTAGDRASGSTRTA